MEYEDRLTIATPEGVELSLTLAGAASRFVSALVDLTIQALLLTAIGIAFTFLGNDLGFGGWALAVWAILSFLVITGYDVFFEVLNGGRTPGKMMNGLRVVRIEGQPVGFLTSAIRNVLRILDFLPTMYLIGATVILATRKNQRIGDVVAGTLVVRERKAANIPLPVVTAPGSEPPYGTWDTSQITPEELGTVRQFLERRRSIEDGARRDLAETLSARLRPKVTGAPPDLRGEPFLEALAAARRARS